MIGFTGMLALTIAFLGLLGITITSTQSRLKEISIRKVIGASEFSLVKLLARSGAQVMLLSVLVATPISVLLGNRLLQELSQRITLGADVFIPGMLIVVGLSLLTICSQIIRVVLANPVKNLRMD